MADLGARREVERMAAKARVAALSAELKGKQEAERAEIRRLAATVRGGLLRIGCTHSLSDGWRTFELSEALEFVDMADHRGAIDGDYVREFYRLWTAGHGYCHRKGISRGQQVLLYPIWISFGGLCFSLRIRVPPPSQLPAQEGQKVVLSPDL